MTRGLVLGWMTLALLLGALGCAAGAADPAEPEDTSANNTPANNTPSNNGGNDCFDRDGDGFGRGASCFGPDCDDTNAALTTDCGGCVDNDGDGFGQGPGCRGTDCNDSDASVNPGAVEVPGNGKDDDCVGGDLDCIDNDGDGFGTGGQCRGADCDDTDRNVRPGAREICGNGKDDDCAGGDEECPVDCVDADGDGYGQGAGCRGADCDDQNPNVNPGADEICNGQDDNCVDGVDECDQALKVCDPNRGQCVGAVQGSCSTDNDCLGGLVCAGNTCLGTEGVSCQSPGDCVEPFLCTSGRCAQDPNFDVCEDLNCEAGDMVCLREEATCVECIDHFDCPGLDLCAGNACMPITDRTFTSEANAARDMAQFLADCFNGGNDDDIIICGIIDAFALENPLGEDEVFDYVCDDATAADFVGGERDLTAAENVVGCGIFNDDDLTWERSIQPDSFWEICMWTVPPAIFFDERSVVVERCEEFPVDR